MYWYTQIVGQTEQRTSYTNDLGDSESTIGHPWFNLKNQPSLITLLNKPLLLIPALVTENWINVISNYIKWVCFQESNWWLDLNGSYPLELLWCWWETFRNRRVLVCIHVLIQTHQQILNRNEGGFHSVSCGISLTLAQNKTSLNCIEGI